MPIDVTHDLQFLMAVEEKKSNLYLKTFNGFKETIFNNGKVNPWLINYLSTDFKTVKVLHGRGWTEVLDNFIYSIISPRLISCFVFDDRDISLGTWEFYDALKCIELNGSYGYNGRIFKGGDANV